MCYSGYGYVALKIVPSATHEAEMVQQLVPVSSQTNHPGNQQIVSLLDCFKLHGPKLTYDVLVMEPTTGSAENMKQSTCSMTINAAKKALVKVAAALDLLHSLGMCHGDFRSGNVCFAIPRVNDLSETEVMGLLGKPEGTVLERWDNEPLHPLLPRYTISPSPFPYMGQEIQAKLVDFGQGQ